ncbi:MAG: RNA polymerase sigma factor, partial [Bacteroidota bacterium]
TPRLRLEQLIKRCKKKDVSAQKVLYEIYRQKLFSICLKYTASYAEAEDHLHDVFIEIYQKIHQYKGIGSFEGWMKRIAINKAIDRYKKKTTFELAQHKENSLIDEVYLDFEEPNIPFEKLLQFIQELPDQYRLIFSLYELDGYSHKAIAKQVRISESTSKSNLFRAKQRLKKRISDYLIQTRKEEVHE